MVATLRCGWTRRTYQSELKAVQLTHETCRKRTSSGPSVTLTWSRMRVRLTSFNDPLKDVLSPRELWLIARKAIRKEIL